MRIDQNTIIGDILDANHTCEEVFLSFDMPCMDCPSSRGETLEEACELHGVEMDVLLEALRTRFENPTV